jgi:signal transduction histidine kinase/ligand-binding sensor domain-containing protein
MNPRSIFVGALALLALTGAAARADGAGWRDRADTIFRTVARQGGGDSHIPYTGPPGVLAQDASGFVWIGTDTGLARWDGYQMRTYTAHAGARCALPSDYVTALWADERGGLWVGTFTGGVVRYDAGTDCFTTFPTGHLLHDAVAESIEGDGSGGLWIGTRAGLLHVAANGHDVAQLAEAETEASRLVRERIPRMHRDRHGVLWIGTDRGLLRRAPTEARFALVRGTENLRVRAILEGADGRVWFGTVSNGAFVLDPRTLAYASLPRPIGARPPQLLWRAIEAPDGRIWFASGSEGIVVVDPATLHSTALHHDKAVATTLTDDAVNDLLRDRRGLIWVATVTGVQFTDVDSPVATVLNSSLGTGFPDGLPGALTGLGPGRLALAVGGHLVAVERERAGFTSLLDRLSPPAVSVPSLEHVPGVGLFAGVTPVGLVRIDLRTGTPAPVDLPGEGLSRHVLSLSFDGERLWIGALEGVWTLDRDALAARDRTALTARFAFEAPPVFAIEADPRRNVWLGTARGIFRAPGGADPQRVPVVDANGTEVADPHVTALHMDAQGRLWVAANGHGLLLLDPDPRSGARLRIARQWMDDLPGGPVTQLVDDLAGGIWIATGRGLARIDAATGDVRRFGAGDGVVLGHFHGDAAVRTTEGELVFGGQDGFSVVRPGQPATPRPAPPVVVTRVVAGGTEAPCAWINQDAARSIEVPADAQSLSVEFAALDYADPEGLRYGYMLEDYDSAWRHTDATMRMAMYTHLPPGSYRLRIRAADHAGHWSGRERLVPVHVAAAWYQTVWFRLATILAVLGGVALLVRARTEILRAREKELVALVDERTRSLVRVTEARNALIENLAHDLRTPITSLKAYLERLTLKNALLTDEDRTNYVAIALRQAERLRGLVQELFDLVRLNDVGTKLALETVNLAELAQDVVQELESVADGRSIVFHPPPPPGPPPVVADIGLVHRLIGNLLENALRHTPAGGTVAVEVAGAGDSVTLTVSDTGSGIASDDLARIFERYERADTGQHPTGAGLGLTIARRIVELHRGEISVSSEIGVGTTFVVRLLAGGPG